MTGWARGLLPGADEVIRCAPHARDHGYDPGGTAIAADVLLVVEVPPPWPKPIADHEALAGLPTTAVTPRGAVRILAAVPGADGSLRLRRFDRTPHDVYLTDVALDGPADIARALRRELRTGVIPARATRLVSPTVLVCAQGTHDVCCGIEGTRLALELAEAAPTTEVIRVSHTGGHRFAPTAMSLPDGRMWATLDVATYLTIRDQTVATSEVASSCRGWWGAAPGAAQIAERAVFATVGWDWEQRVRTTTPDARDETLWRVTGDGETWLVRVEAVREVPVLSCRSPGGLPAKSATEYAATIVARR